MTKDREYDQTTDIGVAPEDTAVLAGPPPMYRVLLLNDDYTPMEFVVQILEVFFGMDREKATRVMLHVHTCGRGDCGVFSRDVAETRVAQVNRFSRQHHHPLLCTMEEA